MIIRLKSFARYRDLLGGEMEVDLPEGSTVFELLNKLASRSSDLRDHIFDASGNLALIMDYGIDVTDKIKM